MKELPKLTKTRLKDIKMMAVYWESVVSSVEYPTRRLAMLTVNMLACSYARALGVRTMTLQQDISKLVFVSTIMMTMIEEVQERPHFYTTLEWMGFADMDKAQEIVREIANEALGLEES